MKKKESFFFFTTPYPDPVRSTPALQPQNYQDQDRIPATRSLHYDVDLSATDSFLKNFFFFPLFFFFFSFYFLQLLLLDFLFVFLLLFYFCFFCQKIHFTRAIEVVMSRIMYELEVCSDGTTEAQPRSFRQNRPTASTLSDIMQVQHMSRKIRENAETFPYLAKL